MQTTLTKSDFKELYQNALRKAIAKQYFSDELVSRFYIGKVCFEIYTSYKGRERVFEVRMLVNERDTLVDTSDMYTIFVGAWNLSIEELQTKKRFKREIKRGIGLLINVNLDSSIADIPTLLNAEVEEW